MTEQKECRPLKRLRGLTIAEDQSTACFGMPRAAIDAGVVDAILPLPQVADGIMQCLKKGGSSKLDVNQYLGIFLEEARETSANVESLCFGFGT